MPTDEHRDATRAIPAHQASHQPAVRTGDHLGQHPGQHPVRERREPDAVSLVIGAVFLGLTAGWLLTWTGALPYASLGWFLPVLLIVAGLLGVLFSRRRG